MRCLSLLSVLLLGLLAAPAASGQAASPQLPVPAVTLRPPSPNPFSQSTTLTVEAHEDVQGTLTIYDLLGQRVATLHDGSFAADVPRRFRLEADGLPSGVYLARLEAEDGSSATRRLLLVR